MKCPCDPVIDYSSNSNFDSPYLLLTAVGLHFPAGFATSCSKDLSEWLADTPVVLLRSVLLLLGLSVSLPGRNHYLRHPT